MTVKLALSTTCAWLWIGIKVENSTANDRKMIKLKNALSSPDFSCNR
jgi:hypothetical protein